MKYKTVAGEVEAIQFTRNNISEVEKFIDQKLKDLIIPESKGRITTASFIRNSVSLKLREGYYIVKYDNNNLDAVSSSFFDLITYK